MKKQIIPFFSSQKGTKIINYQRFENLSAYLKECSKDLRLGSRKSPHLFPLMEACNYRRNKSEIFKERQKDWVNCQYRQNFS